MPAYKNLDYVEVDVAMRNPFGVLEYEFARNRPYEEDPRKHASLEEYEDSYWDEDDPDDIDKMLREELGDSLDTM